ncbi:MAG TPA: hypothetical protein VII95_06925 [Terriglobales bacterium]
MRRADAVVRMCADARPEIVIHLAAVVGGIGANRRESGTLEQARLQGVSKFVAVGTVLKLPQIHSGTVQGRAVVIDHRGMLNVFHHISDAAAFLSEAARCLVPNGRSFIADQNRGWISSPILHYFHGDRYAPESKSWQFASTGP